MRAVDQYSAKYNPEQHDRVRSQNLLPHPNKLISSIDLNNIICINCVFLLRQFIYNTFFFMMMVLLFFFVSVRLSCIDEFVPLSIISLHLIVLYNDLLLLEVKTLVINCYFSLFCFSHSVSHSTSSTI